jgi:hypothetical protein
MTTEGIKIGDLRLIVGVVQDNEDPEKLQRVKAVIPGVFDNSTMDVEAMPWIYPLMHFGWQTYSTMSPGTKIWVIIDPNNYYGYYYFPFYQLNDNTKSHVQDTGETDVLMSRSVGSGNASIFYNNDSGVMIQIGNSKVNIKSNGDIVVYSGKASFKIIGGICYAGKDGGGYEQMVLGNKLKTVLGSLSSDLMQVATTANSSPYTACLYSPLQTASNNLKNGIEDILSESSKVSE